MKMHLNYLDKWSKDGNRKADVFLVGFFFLIFSIMLMTLLADKN